MASPEQRISSGNQDTAHQYRHDDYDDNVNRRSFNNDMTGSEQRISSGNQDTSYQYHHDDSVEGVNNRSSTNSILPELRSNLNSIIDKCEQNIIENYKKIQDLSDRGIPLDAEKRNIRKVIEQHDQLIQTLDTVVNIFENFVVNDDGMSLDQTAEAFRKLQDQNHNNYMAYELQKIASGFVIPKLASSMETWESLMDPTKYLDSIKQWKDILSMRDNIEDTRRTTPYCELILNAWIPPVKRAIQEWDCQEPEPLTDFLEIWVPLIPLKLIVDELKTIVLEKLTTEVTKWDPQTDIPIHRWIYAWLPLLGDKINTAIISILKRDLPFTSIQRLITQKLAEFISAGPESSLSFTELVEKKCTERDIEFIPTGDRYQDRYDVYKFGNFQVFISVDVLYVKQSESNWKATALDDLLNMAK